MAAAIAAAVAEDNTFLNVIEEPEQVAPDSNKLEDQYMQQQDDQDEDQEDKRSGQPVINYVEEEEDSGPAQ